MLRLPPFQYHRPTSVAEALGTYDEHRDEAMYVAGGTDLIPNMKHRLFEPGHLISLRGVREMKGIARDGGDLRIGAAETLAAVAGNRLVRGLFPALAEAAGHVAGPQLRNSGTIGGNLCLDTRCTYYNQTEFWRGALGYCLKKDGDVCHVTGVGKKCVAAHSADTPPVLATLGAVVELAGPDGERRVSVNDLFVTDGIWNSCRAPGEVLVAVRVPVSAALLLQGYAKLRQRRSIDFPLLSVAVSVGTDGPGDSGPEGSPGVVSAISGVVTALGARPRALTGWRKIALGKQLDEETIDALAERAWEQCHPLGSITIDPEWRRAMVPVYVRRALTGMRAGAWESSSAPSSPHPTN